MGIRRDERIATLRYAADTIRKLGHAAAINTFERVARELEAGQHVLPDGSTTDSELIVDALEQAADDFAGRTVAKNAAEVRRLKTALKRAALVVAADELEQLHDKSPHLPVLVAIRNLYRLALGLV